jgi:hypothetical protein
LGDPERAAIQKELDQLEGDDEATEALRLDLESLLRPDATEYDQACVMAIHKAAPETLAAGTALPFGYEILEGNRVAMTHETTGQLVQIGLTANGLQRKVRISGSIISLIQLHSWALWLV